MDKYKKEKKELYHMILARGVVLKAVTSRILYLESIVDIVETGGMLFVKTNKELIFSHCRQLPAAVVSPTSR